MVDLANEYGWFSPADFEHVVEVIDRSPDHHNIILVGGQALTAWIYYFGIPIPETGDPHLTQDADFLGGREAAEFLARELGGKVFPAKLEDNTINVAVVTFASADGERLCIDFLSCVHGLKDHEVKKLATPLSIAGRPPINVLHPLLCLKSRFENLAGIPRKRNPAGIAQARVAVDVAASFIETLIEQDSRREMFRAAFKVAEIAASPAGVFVHAEYGIDPLIAVKPEKFPHQNFQAISWPNAVDRVIGKREIETYTRMRRAQLIEKRATRARTGTIDFLSSSTGEAISKD